MAAMTKAQLIWSRACQNESAKLLVGDKALAALLAFHSPAMNGGAWHAGEFLGPDVEDAASGYRFFGFDEVADLLEGVTAAMTASRSDDELDALEAELNKQYGRLIPWDTTLSERFEAYLRNHPEEFAPL
jgi:hypothetical protein